MPVAYKCRSCGIIKPVKWTFRCPGCQGFYDIRQVNEDIPGAAPAEVQDGEVVSLQDAVDQVVEIPRIETGLLGMDYVLGNKHQVGFAKNGLYLLTGDPGCGKTTLLIQTLQAAARLRYDALYITGEQTVGDLALRARSFGKLPARFVAVRETDLDVILDIIDERQPAIAVVDSAQTIFVDDELEIGGAQSIKTAIRELMKCAKETNTTIIVIGHVTKGGAIGGPKALEHYVDCSFHISGNKTNKLRTLRCDTKNRFGETPRQARFEMSDLGLMPLDKFELREGQLIKIEEEEEEESEEQPQEEKPAKKPKKTIAETPDEDLPAEAPKPPKKTKPKLVSVPLDATPAPAPETPSLPKSVLPPFWTAHDGTKAEVVFAVPCDEPECKGKIDRACTAENGAREAGFHASRIRKGKLHAAGRDATATPKRKTKAELDAEAPGTPDPFAPKELSAKPRVTTKRTKKPAVDPSKPLGAPPRLKKKSKPSDSPESRS